MIKKHNRRKLAMGEVMHVRGVYPKDFEAPVSLSTTLVISKSIHDGDFHV
jgi:hypothetical protein